MGEWASSDMGYYNACTTSLYVYLACKEIYLPLRYPAPPCLTNSELVDEATFLRNFWSAFNDFSDGSTPESPGMPAYFRFLTLLGKWDLPWATSDIVLAAQ